MTKKPRFNAAHWIDLGLSQLSQSGVDAIKLEAICSAAKLTRGSFYYHFKDHEAFLIDMVKRWSTLQTQEVAAQIDGDISAESKATALTDAAMQIDYRLELGIRELARRVPDVAAIVEQTDAKRLALLTEIYVQRFAIDTADASQLAYLEYAAFCGMILLSPDMDAPRQQALAERYDAMVQASLR